MRILTLNIRTSRGVDPAHPWISRRRPLVSLLREIDPDIALLQEVRRRQLDYLARNWPSHHMIHAGRNDGEDRGEMLVTAVRRSSRSPRPEHRVRWFSETPGRPSSFGNERPLRICLEVLMDGLTLLNVHLQESPNRHLEPCAALLAAWTTEPSVIGGDFNAPPDSPRLAPLWRAGYRDVLGDLPASGRDCATHHGFSGRTDGSRIDHILVSSGVESRGAHIVHRRGPSARRGRLVSDHWPVFADLFVPSVAV